MLIQKCMSIHQVVRHFSRDQSGGDVTLNCKHELFGVKHRGPLVLALFPPLTVTPPLLALAPEVGAAVHAGDVEYGDTFQGDAAEVQSNTITLLERRKQQREKLS